jgi:hypothetical protein
LSHRILICFCTFAPVWSAASGLEELAFEHGGFPVESVRFLNKLRSDVVSVTASGPETPVTTGLLVFICGAALGNILATIVQAIDSDVWYDRS